MSSICKVCGYSGEMEEYQAREMFFGTREAFDYFQCPSCGCLQIKEVPSDLEQYYPENYYSKNVDFEAIVKEKKIQRYIQSMSSYLSNPSASKLKLKDKDMSVITHLGMKKNDRILDVGCGAGRLAYIMKEAGFDYIFGADPFIDGEIVYANGLTVYKKSIDQLPDDIKWDFIMFHHSFEHVTNPLEVLECAKNLLKDGGKLVIRIPVVGYAWEKYGVDWYQLDAPRHLFLHSKESMKFLADKTGLVIDEIKYDSTSSQFTISENYQKGIPLIRQEFEHKGFKRIKEKYRKLKFKKISKVLNANMDGDQAAFILSRA